MNEEERANYEKEIKKRIGEQMEDQTENKLKCEVAIARIQLLLNKYYEDVGRGLNMNENFEQRQQDLIEDIDEILDKTDIDKKILIIEQLELDKLGVRK